MRKRKKVLLWFVSVLGSIILIWFIFNGIFFAYCSDAYIRAHVAEIAPRVEGHLTKVLVENNDYVKKGQLLLQIESYPYELKRNVKKASLLEQQTQLKIYKINFKTAQKQLKAVEEQYRLANINEARYKTLLLEQACSKEKYESILNIKETVQKEFSEAQEKVLYWQQSVDVQMTVINSQKAELALAEYYLSLTKVVAPVDGYVTNINCRPGDFVKPGEPLFGLLDNRYWWVESNYKEYVLNRIKEGQKVWVVTDLYPFTVLEGKVENFDRAIRRTDTKSSILPYVSPTTDWIRLSRRFQVRIKFNEDVDKYKLFMGADARTLVFLW